MKIFKHLRSEWFRYGFETLAVVVGILAAFALCDKLAEREAISNAFIQSRYEPYHFEHYMETTRLSEFYGIRGKYLDAPREQALVSEDDIVDDFKLEILILIRLVHSEAEKEIYHQLIDASFELQASIRQILS